MSNQGAQLRAMAISFFIVAISFFNFVRLNKSECISAIHIVTLLICGIGIGIFLSNLFAIIKGKRQ